MAGNLVLRAMEIEPDIKAGVIWAGAVYSYDDFTNTGSATPSYRPPPTPETRQEANRQSRSQEIFDTYGRPDTQVDYWKAVSLTEKSITSTAPIQLHHAAGRPGGEYRLFDRPGGGVTGAWQGIRVLHL